MPCSKDQNVFALHECNLICRLNETVDKPAKKQEFLYEFKFTI